MCYIMWLENPKKFYICDQRQLEANSQLINVYSNYLESHNKSDECSLQIHSVNGVVRLEIVYFHPEKSFDKVTFYDGADSKAKLLESYTAENATVISSGQYMFINYDTDGLTRGSRFHFRFISG